MTLLLVPSRRMARDVPKDHHDGDTQGKEERLGTVKVSLILMKQSRLSVEDFCRRLRASGVVVEGLLALKRAFFLSGGSVTLQ